MVKVGLFLLVVVLVTYSGLLQKTMQISIEGYYNAIGPSFMGEELLSDWTIRTQFQILLPRRAK